MYFRNYLQLEEELDRDLFVSGGIFTGKGLKGLHSSKLDTTVGWGSYEAVPEFSDFFVFLFINYFNCTKQIYYIIIIFLIKFNIYLIFTFVLTWYELIHQGFDLGIN